MHAALLLKRQPRYLHKQTLLIKAHCASRGGGRGNPTAQASVSRWGISHGTGAFWLLLYLAEGGGGGQGHTALFRGWLLEVYVTHQSPFQANRHHFMAVFHLGCDGIVCILFTS